MNLKQLLNLLVLSIDMEASNDIYGVINSDGCHIDVSRTLRVARAWAAKNGYDKVSVRFNCGYHVSIHSERTNGVWARLYQRGEL